MSNKKRAYNIKRVFNLKIPKHSKVGIWVPVSRSKDDYLTNITTSEIIETDNLKVLFWEFNKSDKSKTEKIVIEETVDTEETSPNVEESFLKNCTSHKGDLVEVDLNILELANNLTKNIKSKSDKVQKIIDYLVKNLKYEYPPKNREAKNVLNERKSDCGGYHSLFVSMLRSVNIPSVMDFGAKLPAFSPHVWAWWFNDQKQEWNMVDVNDIQNNIDYVDRVSYSLGINPSISNFPIKVIFIQNYLSWDYNYERNKSEGVFFEVENINKVKLLQ